MTDTIRAESRRPAYRDGNVVRWVIAYTASVAGDSVYFLFLSWTALAVGGPSTAGVVTAVGALPRAVLMLAGGVLADRFGSFSQGGFALEIPSPDLYYKILPEHAVQKIDEHRGIKIRGLLRDGRAYGSNTR